MKTTTFNFGEQSPGESKFWQLARTIYAQDENWAPQSETYSAQSIEAIQSEKDSFVKGFIVVSEMQVVARAVIINPKGRGPTRLGLFEALENKAEAVHCLFGKCENELRKQGITEYTAPGLDQQSPGLQISGYSYPQSILTPHNPPYYEGYFEENRFSVQTRSISFIVRKNRLILSGLKLPWIKLRHFDPDKLDQEIEIFHKLQREVFKDREGYVVRTLAQDNALIRSLLPLLDPELVIIAENRRGRALGILIALPDHYQAKRPLKQARILSMGTLPEFQARRIGHLLVARLAQTMVKKGYESAEVSWVLKNNQPPQKLSNRFGAEPGREFCLYRKSI